MNSRPAVYLQHCETYDREKLKSFFDQCYQPAGQKSLRSAKVLIKPNLISAKKVGPATTDALFIIALGEWLVDQGASVSVGDSPAFGSCRGVLDSIGAAEELLARNITIEEFDQGRTVTLDCGVDVEVASTVFEKDHVVNAPKVKAHGQMYVTLAVKNIFGIVRGLRKSMIHMRHGGPDNMFAKILVDLVDILPNTFTFADGVIAMHRGGPIHGEPLNLNCLAFSENSVAVDTSLLAVLELSPTKSPLWCEAQNRALPETDLENIQFPMLAPEFFHGSMFEPPAELTPIRFNPFRFVWSNMKRVGLKLAGK